jgi:hypothetical protein
MSGESGEELCKRLADIMGCNMKELRDKGKTLQGRKEIIVAIPKILPRTDDETEVDYSDKEILDITRRLEKAGCVPHDLHDESGPPDTEEEEEEDLDEPPE